MTCSPQSLEHRGCLAWHAYVVLTKPILANSAVSCGNASSLAHPCWFGYRLLIILNSHGSRSGGKNAVPCDRMLVAHVEVLVVTIRVEVKRSCEVLAALQRFLFEAVQALEIVDGGVVQVPQLRFGEYGAFFLPQRLVVEGLADQLSTPRVTGNRVQSCRCRGWKQGASRLLQIDVLVLLLHDLLNGLKDRRRHFEPVEA
jgi:hypothetical protein